MRKLILFLTLLLTIGIGSANAGYYYYIPSDADLGDLDHYYYYKWGITWTHGTETVTAARLTVKNVYDWTYESGDSLYMHLLDTAPVGVTAIWDNQLGGDNFAGNPWIATWSDPYGDYAHATTLTYDFSASLVSTLDGYVHSGNNFGLGFDPDCHYYNDKVKLEIWTGTPPPSVPEPATLTLLGVGLAGFGFALRRKK